MYLFFWCDAVPKELKAQVDYELSYLKQIDEHLPTLSEYNNFHFIKNAIENFESSTDPLSTFSIKNIYYDTFGDFLLAIPVRFQFLCSLFLQSYFQDRGKDIKKKLTIFEIY
jgi:hypothetical protein